MMKDQHINQTIAQRLRAARVAQGLSLAQLSERTAGALSKSRIGNYEQGIRRMGIEQAITLAKALGTVSAAHLLAIDEEELVLSPEEQRLLAAFRAADAAGRARLLELSQAGTDVPVAAAQS